MNGYLDLEKAPHKTNRNIVPVPTTAATVKV